MTKDINWNQLRDWAHETSVKYGFYDDKPSNIHFLCLIISELMEAVEADRKNQRAKTHSKDGRRYEIFSDQTFHPGNIYFKETFEVQIKNTLEDELADVVIRCLDLAGANKIELPYGTPPAIANQGKTFTEKVWFIVQNLVDDRASLIAKLHTTIAQCFQLAREYNIDLVWHIKKKMAYNSLRSPKHGKRY